MKHIFVIVLIFLVLSSLAIWYSLPQSRKDIPVLYWVTDPNPARQKQVRLFHEWMEKNDYPKMELRTDSANNNPGKKVIQGVSGVAGDIIDAQRTQMRYFHALGILNDVTASAKRMGFDRGMTYEALRPDISVDGRQYSFPCNVGLWLLWTNQEAFEKIGMEPPPLQWDFETFERVGREYVKKANEGLELQQYFFHPQPNRMFITPLHRSLGLSVFNETGTRCTLDDPRYVRILRLLHKWTHEDRILPSAADVASFSTESGYGGAIFQLLHDGNYAMITTGRYVLIQLRKMEPVTLAVSHLPAEGFENVYTAARAACLYKGSRYPHLVSYFLKFLASEEYNMHIVRDSDALPPNPIYTKTEAFLRPPDWPNEWGCHEVAAEAARTIAIGPSYSPFVLDQTVKRLCKDNIDSVLANRQTPEKAAIDLAERINSEIRRTLKENPTLKLRYEKLLKDQEKIDALRAQSQKVPLSLIQNRFHRKYYEWKGWIE